MCQDTNTDSKKAEFPAQKVPGKAIEEKTTNMHSRHQNQAKLSHINCLRRLILKF
jgi:hypothetical protein